MSTLQDVMKEINKSYGEEIFVNGNSLPAIKRIPFSSPRANYMTYGGIPRGRIIELAGEEGSGKTTTALDLCASAIALFEQEYNDELEKLQNNVNLNAKDKERLEILQDKGPQKIIYADLENTLDAEWCDKLGLDLESPLIKFYKAQGQSAEEIFEDLIKIMDTGEVGLVVIDSLGVMVSAQAYDKSIEQKTYGGISMPLTLFSKKANATCKKTGCTLIGINQVRDNMNSPYGGLSTTGGRAWKHNCSVRLMFKKGDFINEESDSIKKSSESPAGNRILIEIQKTKAFKPDRRLGYYTLNYNNGIDVIADLTDICCAEGYIAKGGAWFTFLDPETKEILVDENDNILKIQGRKNVIKFLHDNEEVRRIIMDSVNKLITK